jgi:hypothetical protein
MERSRGAGEQPGSWGDPCLGANLFAKHRLIDFDPTRGSVGALGLVAVAVVRDPRHATPLHSTFLGLPSDHLAMEVQVNIEFDTPIAVDGNCRARPSPTVRPPSLTERDKRKRALLGA